MEIQVRGSLNKESEVMGGLSFELYERYAYRTDKAAVFLSKQFLSRILDAYYYEPHDILAEYDHVIYSDLDGKKVIMLRCDIDTYKVTVRKRDIPDIINYLRDNYNFFYDPNRKQQFESLSSAFYCCDSKLVTETQRLQEENKKLKKKLAEQQKKIDSYEATLSKITDIMEPKYAGPAWSETWDDLVERIKRMKKKVETLEEDLERLDEWRDRALEAERQLVDAQVAASKFRNNIRGALGLNIKEGCTDAMVEEMIKNLNQANMGVKELKKFRDEVYNALNLGYPTTNQHILKVLKERLTTNDFYVEGIDAAEYRAFVMKLFEVTGRAPDAEEWIRTNYLAGLALADVKELKQKLEDIKNICDGNSDVMNIIGE